MVQSYRSSSRIRTSHVIQNLISQSYLMRLESGFYRTEIVGNLTLIKVIQVQVPVQAQGQAPGQAPGQVRVQDLLEKKETKVKIKIKKVNQIV